MSESFDPYRKWLGIPAAEQPPHHYRLLAIHWFEDDPDVIEAAADRQMIHIRTYQMGKHSELSQKILNELAAARVCLLNPEKKAAYDAELRAQCAQRAQAWEPKGPPFGFFVQGAGQYFAAQAKRFWISQVDLTRLYRTLGCSVWSERRYADRLADIHAKLARVDESLAETEELAEEPKSPPKELVAEAEDEPAADAEEEPPVEPFSVKLKRLGNRLIALMKQTLFGYKRRRLLSRLGRAAYELDERASGPESVTEPIALARARLDQLRSEVARLSEVPNGQLLSGQRLAWLVTAIVVSLVLVAFWLRWML